jgi:hypothetical protein
MRHISSAVAAIFGTLLIAQGQAGLANMPDSSAGAFKIEALCTISNAYETCSPQISGDKLIINFPTEIIVLLRSDIVSIETYDSRTRQLIRLFANTGDVDFAISFRENGKLRSGFVRFKNNRSVEKFARAMSAFTGQKIGV